MDLPGFLTRCPDGEIVLAGHRIGLYSVIDLYERGHTPAQIHDELPTLELHLIQSVIAFREAHPGEVDAYVAQYRSDLDRQEASSEPSPAALRIRRRIAERTTATAGDSRGES
jgi:uncharacterized protein (DUF433 family)